MLYIFSGVRFSPTIRSTVPSQNEKKRKLAVGDKFNTVLMSQESTKQVLNAVKLTLV